MKREKHHSRDTTALIRDIEITDSRKDKVQQVAGRWLAQSNSNVTSPIIRVQAKESPHSLPGAWEKRWFGVGCSFLGKGCCG